MFHSVECLFPPSLEGYWQNAFICLYAEIIHHAVLWGLAAAARPSLPQQLLQLWARAEPEPCTELLPIVSFPCSSPTAAEFSLWWNGVRVTSRASSEPALPEGGGSRTRCLTLLEQPEDQKDIQFLMSGSHCLISLPVGEELWKYLLGWGAF